jgi:hypothetical protein
VIADEVIGPWRPTGSAERQLQNPDSHSELGPVIGPFFLLTEAGLAAERPLLSSCRHATQTLLLAIT